MALVTVTMPLDLTCHYWFWPQAVLSPSGAGAQAPSFQEGFLYDGVTPLSVQLDNGYLWDVQLQFRNAEPVNFQGFQPGSGGELLTLLTAQGWTP